MEPQFPKIPSDRADDLHHLEYAHTADLVLFMAGNQFMDMYRQAGGDELVHRIMEEKRRDSSNLFDRQPHSGFTGNMGSCLRQLLNESSNMTIGAPVIDGSLPAHDAILF
ncbi:MAG: hypothetical protein JRH12_09820 [Deltaproteobacteria bacterium]|jgi:hypothetical protein|nr:hypothetical protein [Deltaproteobacteria bacterium]MBW2481438.1 hypothetical protein [Deltaproteobacteria bacterium]